MNKTVTLVSLILKFGLSNKKYKKSGIFCENTLYIGWHNVLVGYWKVKINCNVHC